MKKTFCCTVVILMIFSILVGCNYLDGYRVYQENGQYYLTLGELFDKYRRGDGEPLESLEAGSENIYFDSVREMYSDIWAGNFTRQEFRKLATIQKTKEGNIPLPDLDNLREPVLSDAWNDATKDDTYRIAWYATSYTFRYALTDEYSSTLQIWRSSQNSNQNYMEDFKNPEEYETRTIVAGEDEYIILQKETASGLFWIYIFGVTDGVYFKAELRNAKQCPSDEMIAGISMVPFHP